MLLALEAPLIARLRAQLPGAPTVVALRALGDLSAARVPTPGVIVAYAGGTVLESRADGRAARVSQRWQLACVARNVANASDDAAAAGAAALADATLAALLGWKPAADATALRLSDLPAPLYGSGYLGLPLELTTELVLRA